MPDSYFTLIEESSDACRYVAAPSTAGPWSPARQHGGPPNALAVAAAERAVAGETGRSDLVALRLSADFVGPVPVGEIEVRTRVLRAARTAALVAVSVAGNGRDCLHCRVWFVRDADTGALAAALPAPQAVPDLPPGLDADFGYGDSLEWRRVRGGMSELGPGSTWVRPRTPLVEGYELSGLARCVLIADAASGISAELDWSAWSFVNVDLDVHLARPLAGDWVFMDAATQLGAHGSALARSTLSDLRGVVGSSLQTLVVAPIPTG